MTQLNKLLTLKGEALRRGLHNTEFSKEDKRKSFKAINNNTNGGGSVSKYAPRYFKIDWNKASEDWKYVFSGNYEGKDFIFFVFRFASTIKSNFDWETGDASIVASQWSKPDSFSYNILYIPNSIKNNLGINYNFCSFEQIIEVVNKIGVLTAFPVNLSMEGITEITEEEYYNID